MKFKVISIQSSYCLKKKTPSILAYQYIFLLEHLKKYFKNIPCVQLEPDTMMKVIVTSMEVSTKVQIGAVMFETTSELVIMMNCFLINTIL